MLVTSHVHWGIGGGWGYWPYGIGSFSLSGDLEDEGDGSGILSWTWNGSGVTVFWRLTLTGDDGTIVVDTDGTTWEVVAHTRRSDRMPPESQSWPAVWHCRPRQCAGDLGGQVDPSVALHYRHTTCEVVAHVVCVADAPCR